MANLALTVEQVKPNSKGGFRIVLRGEGITNEFGIVPGRCYNMNVATFKGDNTPENIIGKEISVDEERVTISEFESTGEKTFGKTLKYYWIK